jgi:hypothetical protein
MCDVPSLLTLSILAAAGLAAILFLPPVMRQSEARKFAHRMHGFGGFDGRDWVDLRPPVAVTGGEGGGWGGGDGGGGGCGCGDGGGCGGGGH